MKYPPCAPSGGTYYAVYLTVIVCLATPKVSGAYISSALAGGTTNVPGVVARAMVVFTVARPEQRGDRFYSLVPHILMIIPSRPIP